MKYHVVPSPATIHDVRIRWPLVDGFKHLRFSREGWWSIVTSIVFQVETTNQSAMDWQFWSWTLLKNPIDFLWGSLQTDFYCMLSMVLLNGCLHGDVSVKNRDFTQNCCFFSYSKEKTNWFPAETFTRQWPWISWWFGLWSSNTFLTMATGTSNWSCVAHLNFGRQKIPIIHQLIYGGS